MKVYTLEYRTEMYPEWRPYHTQSNPNGVYVRIGPLRALATKLGNDTWQKGVETRILESEVNWTVAETKRY